MRKLFRLLTIITLLVYLYFALTQWSSIDRTGQCQLVQVEIVDSARIGFIRQAEVMDILRKQKVDPTGKRIKDINTRKIEEVLRRNKLIDSVVCAIYPLNDFKQTNAAIQIQVWQEHPVMRIIPNDAADYYVDAEGKMYYQSTYPAYLPVATGHISPALATGTLAELGVLIDSDPLWREQVQQVHVNEQGHLTLAMRVGDQEILLGPPEHLPRKLRQLRLFYTKVNNVVGWHKYKRIDLSYAGQVIATKR
ncbi:MAG: hypothetical protein Q4A44_06350 [Bacteroidales bacterium]|nr:hypothetical protein [Bacteroidales bacterium]